MALPTYIQTIREALDDIPCDPTPDNFRALINILDHALSYMETMDLNISKAANTASCLANGIQPD